MPGDRRSEAATTILVVVQLPPFLLDHWLDQHRDARYNLAASSGPAWRMRELLDLMAPEERERYLEEPVFYTPTSGRPGLRDSIARMCGVTADDVQVLTGASEALQILFFLAAEAGANVVVPSPAFPPFLEMPRALGLETRTYDVRAAHGFRIDIDQVRSLIDTRTNLVLVNSPHNPTGAVIDPETLRTLHDLCAERGVQFVVDEVFHPVYHDGGVRPSATTLPHATVLGDFSKALCLSGLRTGWIIERDRRRRARYWNARAYFTISNSLPAEVLAEVAARHYERLLARARAVADANLALLDRFFEGLADTFAWVRPAGGFTGFPTLRDGTVARPFCERAALRGVLLAPGDCFGAPSHIRVGFGACEHGFARALEILTDLARAQTR